MLTEFVSPKASVLYPLGCRLPLAHAQSGERRSFGPEGSSACRRVTRAGRRGGWTGWAMPDAVQLPAPFRQRLGCQAVRTFCELGHPAFASRVHARHFPVSACQGGLSDRDRYQAVRQDQSSSQVAGHR